LSEPTPGPFVGNLRLLVDIVRFRKGPEDLPVSQALLVACVAVNVVLRTLIASALPLPFSGSPLAILLLDAGATLLFVSLVLGIARCPERFMQTASAIFGTQLVLLPVQAAAGAIYLAVVADPFWHGPVLMLNFMVDVWGLAVMARILRSATGWPLFACVALAVSGELLSVIAITSIFPPVVDQAAQVQAMAQAG
jgi:hypothetical protein